MNCNAEVLHVGFRRTPVKVQEGTGIVTLCAMIMSGENFRAFNVSVYTLNDTAGVSNYMYTAMDCSYVTLN